jgi:large subunit ribosomal protein L13
MSTTLLKKEQARNGWRVVDAEGQVLGRMATQIATALMGKDKATYTPHVDCGDYVVVINADKIKIDWRSKWRTKEYDRYTYYSGGRNTVPFMRMFQRHPDRVIELAVRRMLPKTRLGRQMFKKLKVYAGSEHPHGNFNPEVMEIK